MNIIQRKKKAFLSLANMTVKNFVRLIINATSIIIRNILDENSLVNLEIRGNGEKNLEGVGDKTKNLFNSSLIQNSTSITVNEDGSFTSSAYPAYINEGRTLLKDLCPDLKVDDIVTVNFNTDGVATIRLGTAAISINKGRSVTITQAMLDSNVGLYRKSTALGGGSATISNIQFEIGSQSTNYIKYGYEIPIEIKSKNIVDISTIFNYNWLSATFSDIEADTGSFKIASENGGYGVKLSTLFPDLQANKEYYLLAKAPDAKNQYCYLYGQNIQWNFNSKKLILQSDLDSDNGLCIYGAADGSPTQYSGFSIISAEIYENLYKSEKDKYESYFKNNYSIFLNSPLYRGDIIKYPENIRINSDGTTENINIPIINLSKSTTIFDVNTKIKPFNVKIEYNCKKEIAIKEIISNNHNIKLNNVADNESLIDVKVYGNTLAQEGTPTPSNSIELQSFGEKTNNLFDEKLLLLSTGIIKTQDGYKVNTYPASFTYEATATKPMIEYLKKVIKPDTTYTMARKLHYSESARGEIRFVSQDLKVLKIIGDSNEGIAVTSFSFTQEELDSFHRLYIYGHATIDVYYDWIALYEGEYTIDTLPDYEPYGYKIPIEIKSKNLFNVFNCKGGDHCILNVDGSLTVDNTINNSASYSGTTLKEFCPDLKVGDTAFIRFVRDNTLTSNNEIYLNVSNKAWKNNSAKIITQNDLDSIVHFYSGGTNGEIITANISNIQIELGTEATNYESYINSSIVNIYLDEPLHKIGNYSDYIDLRNGKVVRNIVKSIPTTCSYRYDILNKDTGWACFQQNINLKENNLGLSNMFVRNSNYNITDYIFWLQTSKTYYIFNVKLSDIGATQDNTNAEIASLGRQWVNSYKPNFYLIAETPILQDIDVPKINIIPETSIINVDTSITPSSVNLSYTSAKDFIEPRYRVINENMIINSGFYCSNENSTLSESRYNTENETIIMY